METVTGAPAAGALAGAAAAGLSENQETMRFNSPSMATASMHSFHRFQPWGIKVKKGLRESPTAGRGMARRQAWQEQPFWRNAIMNDRILS
ncbi:hypothetical protein [Nitrospirillum iridis]|uniref:Uncharacterized protein n=1 Tax=Nitrospirillum iridis TaxID=765888 RepID=A0A7X0AV95_9PROT|nr:hypothetical protein [Nitrospirillum iridis]MBB6250733.1 hypothetical protein [Nitrospirillum iridis]